jgi:chromosome segregation ATPase
MQNQQLVAIDKSTLDALKNDIMGAAAVIDTNAAWFSKEMDEVGEKVHDLRTDMNKFIQVKPAGLRMEVEKLRDEGFLPFKTATEQRQTATEQRLAALDVEVKKVRDEELVPLKTATEQRLTALDDEVMEIPALKSDAQRLNGQFQNLNGQLQTANQSIQTLNQHCQMLFNGHNVFQGQIAALEQNRDSFARGISQLKERFDNLTTEDLQQAMIYVIQQTYPDAPHFLARLLEMEKELAKEQEIVEQLQGNANAGGGADEALVQQTLQEVQELKHQFSNFQHTSAAYAKYADHQKTIDDLELETRERKSGDNGIKLRFTDIGLALERMSKRISDWEQKLAGLPVDKLKELAAITQELKELCARLPILEAYVGKLLTITKALNSNFDNPLEGLEWDPLSDHAQSEED